MLSPVQRTGVAKYAQVLARTEHAGMFTLQYNGSVCWGGSGSAAEGLSKNVNFGQKENAVVKKHYHHFAKINCCQKY